LNILIAKKQEDKMALTQGQEQAIQALWVAKDIAKGGERAEALKQKLKERLFANHAFLTAAILNEMPDLIKSLVEAAAGVPVNSDAP
jgi:hypothetical protein